MIQPEIFQKENIYVLFQKLSIINLNTLKMYSKIKLNLINSQFLKKYRIFDLLKIVQNFYTKKNFFELKKTFYKLNATMKI